MSTFTDIKIQINPNITHWTFNTAEPCWTPLQVLWTFVTCHIFLCERQKQISMNSHLSAFPQMNIFRVFVGGAFLLLGGSVSNALLSWEQCLAVISHRQQWQVKLLTHVSAFLMKWNKPPIETQLLSLLFSLRHNWSRCEAEDKVAAQPHIKETQWKQLTDAVGPTMGKFFPYSSWKAPFCFVVKLS